MPIGWQDIIACVIVPASCGFGFCGALLWGSHREQAGADGHPETTRSTAAQKQYVHLSAFALTGGFVAAYLLQRSGPLVPRLNWHWLPWVAILGALGGAFLSSDRRPPTSRVFGWLFLSLLSYWLLLPTWPEFASRRLPWTFALAFATTALSIAQQIYATRHARLSLIGQTLSVGGVTVILALSGSLRFALLSTSLVFGLLGIIGGSRHNPRVVPPLAFPCTLMSTSLLTVAYVQSFSQMPLAIYALPLLILPLQVMIGLMQIGIQDASASKAE